MNAQLQEEIKYLIYRQHNKISEIGEKVACAYDLKLKGAAAQYTPDNTIRYDLDEVLAVGVERLVIHEYAHYLQYTYFGYTEHDFLFFAINQYLVLKHMREKSCYLRAYDLENERTLKPFDLNIFVNHLRYAINMPRPEAMRHCLIVAMAYTQPKDFDHLDIYETNLEKINEIRESIV